MLAVFAEVVAGVPARSCKMGVKFESMESRTLLSSAVLTDGVLKVRGDNDFHEAIVLKLTDGGTKLNVVIDNADMGSFNLTDITKVNVNALTGGDEITIDESGGRIRNLKMTLNGGGGNDTITVGRDRVRAYGGDGNDRIKGRGFIDGGIGNDSINGSSSKDYIFAGEGRDTVDAEEGNDVVWGGAGNDRLEGDEGNDIVFGEDGDDTITGGEGDDRLFGGANIDRIEGEAGADTLYGGRADDVLIGGEGVDESTYGEYAKIESLMSSQLAKAKAYVPS
jgi:Ca2+-binding RTX toxin-like protein